MKHIGVLICALLGSSAAYAAPCSDLTKFKIPGMNLAITKAEVVPAKDALPQHCHVDGMVDQHVGPDGKSYGIGFAVALPDNWNHRFLYQGGGLYNGLVRPPLGAAAAAATPGLARGFVVASSDTGHQSEQASDTSFNVDQQASRC